MLAFISLFLNIPIGTAMGVYTMWVLLPASSEQEYAALVARHKSALGRPLASQALRATGEAELTSPFGKLIKQTSKPT